MHPPASPVSGQVPSTRLLALDIFRGMTIALMIVVNTAGNGDVAWAPLQHARWHGFTPTDLVFPSFLFAIGVSAWFSLKRYGHRPGRDAFLKIWKRTAILFAIGVVMWYVPPLVSSLLDLSTGEYVANLLHRFRVMGVLQRLALCYGIGASLALVLSRRALIGLGAAILLGYWGLLWAFDAGTELYALQTNAALRLDLWLLGPDHLYHGERVDGVRFAFDPEGVLSTLPAIVTFVIGYVVGEFLDRTKDRRYAISDLFPVACLLIAAGFLWGDWFGFPINKKLWTSSYTLYAAGWSLLALSLVVWAVDVHGRRRWFAFFDVFGRNPLLAYLSSELLAVTLFTISVPLPDGTRQSGYAWLYQHSAAAVAGDNAAGSFLFAVGFTLVNWLLAWACYKRGIIIKI